jgi:hypothetical protein
MARKDGKHSPPTACFQIDVRGHKAGFLKLCKICFAPARPNTNHIRFCDFHYRQYKRESRKKLWHSSVKRLESCLRALSYPFPMPGIIKAVGIKRYMGIKNSLMAHKLHFRNLLMSHPEKLPPGLTIDNLPR